MAHPCNLQILQHVSPVKPHRSPYKSKPSKALNHPLSFWRTPGDPVAEAPGAAAACHSFWLRGEFRSKVLPFGVAGFQEFKAL